MGIQIQRTHVPLINNILLVGIGITMGVEKTKPRKAINKKTKKSIVFDEKKRKEFLTGFKKRKDERRQKWKEKVERDLKNEIKKIKEETRSKMEKSAGNKSNQICPEIAHLINTEQANTTVKQIDNTSVTVTTFDSLEAATAPWKLNLHKEEESEDESEEEEEEEETEEVPGMSMKPSQPETEKVVIGTKERKAINRAAVKKLQESKAFKTKERLRAKKQRNASRHMKKTMSKKAKHLKKIGGLKKD